LRIRELVKKPYVTLSSATVLEIISVAADDLFGAMTLRGTTIPHAREECRKTADYFEAAALRQPAPGET
jgi:hypothetical protein